MRSKVVDVMTAPEVSRRRFVAGGLGLAGALSLSSVLAACGTGTGSSASPTSGGGGSAINVLGWTDYRAPEMDAAGVTANWTPLAQSPDLYTKTRQAGTFDVGMPTSFLFGTMLDLDLVEPLDESRLPNLGNIDPAVDMSWAYRDGKLYMTPLLVYWSYSIWDKTQTTQPRTFEDLFKPELAGKVGLLDDEITMSIIARLSGDYDGAPLTEQKLEEVAGMLKRLRPQIGAVYPFGSSVDLLARREIAVTVHSNLPEIRHVREAGVDAGAGFYGSYAGIDGLCIIKGANNTDAAYTYLNHSLTAPVQLSVTAASGTAVTVKGTDGQASDVVQEFGGVANILKNALVLKPIPAEGSDGVAGFADMSTVWREFKESM
jgi:spermidine/putrescine transport system substrate-binding protein